jgi:hypothetical protein
MPRKRVIKTHDAIPPTLTITLGEEETPMTPTAPTTPPAAESSYPLEPLEPLIMTLERVLPPSNDTQEEPAPAKDTQPEAPANGAQGLEKLCWTEEMIEMLVDVLYEVFEKGGAADNSFKKATFELVAAQVGKAYKGLVKVTQQHCKNKWQDLKGKWNY